MSSKVVLPEGFGDESGELLLLVERFNETPTIERLWQLVDEAWLKHGCNNRRLESSSISSFYGDPVWILNGLYTENDSVSMAHRCAITGAIAILNPSAVMDFGGGFGTVARLLAAALPKAEINICEPFPLLHAVLSCKPFPNIRFVPKLTTKSVDVLVSIDVLEHVPDPLSLLVAMVDAVRPGGHLLIANCFYPVIACHLPCTFHLRYSFDAFCLALGLEVLGPCEGSHATIYRRTQELQPDWPRLRAMEHRSQRLFARREWRGRHITPWLMRAQLAVTLPLHYPRELLRAVSRKR